MVGPGAAGSEMRRQQREPGGRGVTGVRNPERGSDLPEVRPSGSWRIV